jgi:hypothetical protein
VANIIKPKRSESTGQTPTLSPGELAVNIADHKIWVADSSGTPVLIVDGNAAPTETDPVFTSSASYSITTSDITNWNTAYGWGDHSAAGYLTSETDPTFTASAAYSITTADITNWNTAYGWGDHASVGYLTAETDPIFTASDAASITATDIGNWNTAYGWGDHSTIGYLTTETDPVFTASDAASITATDISNWNAKPDSVAITSSGSTITVTDNTAGGAVSYNLETPQGIATTDSPSFAGLTVASLIYPSADGTNGQVLVTDGAGNLSFATAGGGASALDDLTDVTIITPAANDVLVYNSTSSQWENTQIDSDFISEGTTNLYYTDGRARSALSGGTGVSYNSSTGVITNSSPDQTVVLNAGTNISVTGTYPNFTISASGGGSGTVTSVGFSAPTGMKVTNSPITGSGTIALSMDTGYALPTSASQTNWDTAYTNRITSLTTTGSSGSATLVSNTLNIPTYTLAGLGGQASSTNLTSLSGLTYVSASFVKMTASGTFSLDTSTYLTANQTITLSGDVTGSGSTAITTTLATVGATKGGTGQTTYTLGDTLYSSASNTLSKLSGNTTTTRKFLRQTGTGTVSAAPAWDTVTASDVGLGNVSNTAQVTSVTGTSPVSSSGGTTPAISLASGYGDTQNPYASKTANYVLASPNGVAGVPSFRALVAADIPTLNQNTTGTASNVTGTVAIANGGTGATTQQGAINALAGATTSGYFLRGNGTNVLMAAITAADVPTLNQNTTGSSGSCTGNSATATKSTNLIGGNSTTLLGAIPYQSGTDTTTLLSPNTTATKNFLSQTGTGTNGAAPAWSAISKSDVGLGSVENTALSTWAGSANISSTGTITSGTWSGSVISLAKGGTGNNLTAVAGAVAFCSSSGIGLTLAGTAGQMLQCNGTASPQWVNQSSLAVGSATTSTNLDGGGIGQIPYQTATGATSFIPYGTSGQVLRANGAAAATWEDQGIFSSGRLTLQSGVPISTTDQTSKSILYFTPYDGDKISLYNGSSWATYTFTERSVTLGTLTNNTNYDVFIYNNSGTLVLELTAWLNDTTRNTSLTMTNGVYLKTGALTRRYLGTIRTTSTTTTEDSISKRFVYSFHNRVEKPLYKNGTTSHTYTTASWRNWNNDATLRVEFVIGIDAAQVIHFGSTCTGATSDVGAGFDGASPGYDSINAGGTGFTQIRSGRAYSSRGFYLGYHYCQMQEYGSSGTTFLDARLEGTIWN